MVGILDLHETQRVLAEGELARGKVTTMSYDVSDAGELADLKPGDLITAILVVVRDDIHLDDIKKVAAMPPPLFR